MTGSVHQALAAALGVVLGSGFPALAEVAQAETAEAFFISEVDAIVQDKCVSCHRSGGRPRVAVLTFYSRAQPAAIMRPSIATSTAQRAERKKAGCSLRSRAAQVTVAVRLFPRALTRTKCFQIICRCSPRLKTRWRQLHRVMLEEPIEGEIHTGVGNLRGWSLATDGVSKIEVLWMAHTNLMRLQVASGQTWPPLSPILMALTSPGSR